MTAPTCRSLVLQITPVSFLTQGLAWPLFVFSFYKEQALLRAHQCWEQRRPDPRCGQQPLERESRGRVQGAVSIPGKTPLHPLPTVPSAGARWNCTACNGRAPARSPCKDTEGFGGAEGHCPGPSIGAVQRGQQRRLRRAAGLCAASGEHGKGSREFRREAGLLVPL